MNKTNEYLINLFLKSVNDEFYFDEDINDIDFNSILKISSINRISNCIYYGKIITQLDEFVNSWCLKRLGWRRFSLFGRLGQ